MGRGVRLHDVLDVVDHVLGSDEDLGCEVTKGNMQHDRVCSKREASATYGVDATVVKRTRSEALRSCVSSGTTVTVRWCSRWHAVFLNFSLSTGDLSYKRISSMSHPVSSRKSYTYRAMNPVPTMPSE